MHIVNESTDSNEVQINYYLDAMVKDNTYIIAYCYYFSCNNGRTIGTHLLSIVPELLFSNSHSDQANTFHSFGTKHTVRLVCCIHQDSFQIWHHCIVVFLELLLQIQNLSNCTREIKATRFNDQRRGMKGIPERNQRLRLRQSRPLLAPFVCHSTYQRTRAKRVNEILSFYKYTKNNHMYARERNMFPIPAKVQAAC